MLTIINIVKKVLLLIQIIVPLLLIFFGIISFIKLVKDPEEKNGIKKIINQFIAAAVVFMIPVLINVLMGLIGENGNFSSCWNNAGANNTSGSHDYIPIEEGRDKKSPIGSSGKYD